MTKSPTAIGAITLFVLDVQISTRWYGNVFRAPLVFEDDVSAVYKFDNMLVNLLARTAAPGLIAPAEVANPGAGAQFQFTIWTDDVTTTPANMAPSPTPVAAPHDPTPPNPSPEWNTATGANPEHGYRDLTSNAFRGSWFARRRFARS